jgi:hypothetical protein
MGYDIVYSGSGTIVSKEHTACMYVWGLGHTNPALAPRPSMIYCASPLINPLLTPHFEWNMDFVYGGVVVVPWLHEELAQVQNLK